MLAETNIDELSGVDKAIAKFNIHLSILSIKETVRIDQGFSSSDVTADEIKLEIKVLNANKAGKSLVKSLVRP